MHSEGQDREVPYNHNDHASHASHNIHGHPSRHDDRGDTVRNSTVSNASDEDDASSGKASYKSAAPDQRQSLLKEKHADKAVNDHRVSGNSDNHHQSHVRFSDKAAARKSAISLPPLPPGTKPRSRDSDELSGDLARASWTTASFTEVPNALDELTHQHHPSKTSAKDPHVTVHNLTAQGDHDKKDIMAEYATGSDLHAILVRHGQSHASILTKYLRPTMSDEGTQAGIPSWDWLTRLEQMLIHFFLMVFESSNDSSKLIMEMMSTEAGEQIEEIFQLLLKAEPDMYKELGHLVTLAEKWLIHWKGDSEERHRALEYVRLYMQGVKDKNYYTLPVQVRLHKLGAFIAGLKVMGPDSPKTLPPLRYPTYRPTAIVQSVQEPQYRVGSPRVKPATHFSQVVANILCGRPCNDPLPKADVYADQFGRYVFKNTLHGDKEFKTYTDKKYGNLYQKRELFSKDFPRLDAIVDGSGDNYPTIVDRSECVQNVHCWIPKYTKSYVETLQDNGCEILAKADFEKGRKVKECRLGKGNDKACKAIKVVQPKKLYDWVRGTDGKVHRRVVGSYTELGTAASMSKITGPTDGEGGGGSGRRGQGGDNQSSGKKGGMKGGAYTKYPKAVSDTRLGRKSYNTRKSQPRRASKGRYPNIPKEGLGKEEKSTKSGNTGTMNVFKVDRVSLDGSGDSGQEDIRMVMPKDKRKTDEKSSKNPPPSTIKAKASSKFGIDYRGPSNYKPRTTRVKEREQRAKDKKIDMTPRRTGSANRRPVSSTRRPVTATRRPGSPSRAGRGGEVDDFREKDRGFVNIFDKRSPRNKHERKPYKNFKRGRYSIDEEWEGEGFSGWSPRGSESSNNNNYPDKDEQYKRDYQQLLTINQCWEKASKLFKKPSKALVIPPAENLMLYLEKKFPKARWPRQSPIATRNYPNGSVFVAQFGNGSSQVFYPHGGLAVAISGPSPVTSQILVVRDPSDHVFFFDKALMAEINSAGKGIIYGEDGIIKAQYSAIGGFKLDNLEKGKRWQWNQGGQRMLLKLNKYMCLRISDQDKIFLNFYGNHRGFLVNVASGHEVTLMNPDSQTTRVDPVMDELKNLIRPNTMEDNFDYIRGKLNPRRTIGFVDKAKHYANADGNLMGMPDIDINFNPAEMMRMMLLSRGSNGNRDWGNMANHADNFPGYTTINRDSIILNTLPIATYNTVR